MTEDNKFYANLMAMTSLKRGDDFYNEYLINLIEERKKQQSAELNSIASDLEKYEEYLRNSAVSWSKVYDRYTHDYNEKINDDDLIFMCKYFNRTLLTYEYICKTESKSNEVTYIHRYTFRDEKVSKHYKDRNIDEIEWCCYDNIQKYKDSNKDNKLALDNLKLFLNNSNE